VVRCSAPAGGSTCWSELASELGLAHIDGEDRVRIKAHAIRLSLDLSRLQAANENEILSPGLKPDIRLLRDAGAAIAATWFMLCGCNAAIPVEPTVYDLLVSMPAGIKRVQVKTTTYNKDGWQVQVGRRPYSVGNRGQLVPYDPDALDFYFILDGDLTMYLIPSLVLAGRVAVLLRNYRRYIVGDISSLLKCAAPVA
jgi:hypothetical protein